MHFFDFSPREAKISGLERGVDLIRYKIKKGALNEIQSTFP